MKKLSFTLFVAFLAITLYASGPALTFDFTVTPSPWSYDFYHPMSSSKNYDEKTYTNMNNYQQIVLHSPNGGHCMNTYNAEYALNIGSIGDTLTLLGVSDVCKNGVGAIVTSIPDIACSVSYGYVLAEDLDEIASYPSIIRSGIFVIDDEYAQIADYYKIVVASSKTAQVGKIDFYEPSSVHHVTCAQAITEGKKLAKDATSTDIYVITAYVCKAVGSTLDSDNKKEDAWLDDAYSSKGSIKGVGLNLPMDVNEFTDGDKLVISGFLSYNGSTVTIVNGSSHRLPPDTPTKVEEIAAPQVFAENGTIFCSGDFAIFDLLGHNVTHLNGNLSGLYIVKCGTSTTKILVE